MEISENNQSLGVALNEEEYKKRLQNTLEEITRKAQAVTTEASLASVFERELAYFIKTYLNKDIVIDKEVGQSDLKGRRRIFRGRMDAVSNELVIEYKRQGKLDSAKDQEAASRQVESYLLQLKETEKAEYNGILTDGIKIRFFYYYDRVLRHTPFKRLDCNDLDKVVKSLIRVGNKKFVPENIIRDFKLNSENGVTMRFANSLFQTLMNHRTGKTDMLFQEWQELFHLSENDNGQNLDISKRKAALGAIFGREIIDAETDYKALFVLQTTYAVIVKLIACKVVSRLSADRQSDIQYFEDLTRLDKNRLQRFMENLEDGYTFAIGGIRNLLEGDFFSWYASREQWNEEESGCILEIINLLEGYADASFSYGYVAIDIFKDLYMEIMPNEVRHSLGEYFTPSWLADHVIENSERMIACKGWKAIDPCCGSGIFVVSLIRHVIGRRDLSSLSPEEKKKLLDEILTRVQGIDINPLSVLTARVSYLLAIAPLLSGIPIEIPIYLGDSANVPGKILVDGVNCYQYIVSTKQGEINVTLPCGFVESREFLEKMCLIQNTIKAENPEVVYSRIMDCINEEDRKENVQKEIRKLAERLVELHLKHWDGIWLRIATNYMRVAQIRDVDMIVGNPPWVKWEYLPQTYAEKIKKLCLDRHLFSGQTYMGAISLNICALISNVTASSWLNQGGVLAFLMPKTLMTQDSYAGFRNFYTDAAEGKRLYLQKVDDWSKAGAPFIYTTEKFLTYYYQERYADYTSGIPLRFMEKKRGIDIRQINVHDRYEDVAQAFTCRSGRAYQLDRKRTGFTMIDGPDTLRAGLYGRIIGRSDYKARSGVEFTPAEVYFVEPQRESGRRGKYFFVNSEFTNSVYKAEENGGFEAETDYIFPVVKSPCIKEFGIDKSNNYCIFPYKKGGVECVSLAELTQRAEYLADYLIRNKELIEKQSKRSRDIAKGKEFYALSKVGPYTYGDYAVTFRDNTRLVACVVTPIKTPWGKKVMPVCAKHAPYISMDKEGRWITEEEAYYLCGILNTDVVQEYFRFSFSGRSYSIDFNIRMPRYDLRNETHRKIAELSRKAHAVYTDAAKVSEIKKQIEKLYLAVCDEEG